MKKTFCLLSTLTLLFASVASANPPVSKLEKAASEAALAVTFKNNRFSGEGYDTLLNRARASQFFLIGEEHGIAENPLLAAQLFTELSQHHYRHMVIEVSPQIASVMEQHIADKGLQGLQALFAQPGGEPAFFGMAEEAQMLVDVKGSLPDVNNVLLGVDYEVASDRQLLKILKRMNVPEQAKAPLEALVKASEESWQAYYEKKSPQYIFSFNGDPALVKAVRQSWPSPSEKVDWLLEELEQTLAINKLWTSGNGFQSNVARANLIRENFLRHWRSFSAEQREAGMMVKLGGSHSSRGKNTNGTFDLGSLLPELAAIEGTETVSVLVLPGEGTKVAVLDPVNWKFNPAPAKDGYTKGLQALYAQATSGMTLFDTAALRPLMRGKLAKSHPSLTRSVYSFDYVLIMTGSTPASELAHD